MNEFYTYAFLREDRTPYYIGKGTGKRAWSKRRNGVKPPKNKKLILILKKDISEVEAFKHEVYMIKILGRVDLGTGILCNRTGGGEGLSGLVFSEKHKSKLSKPGNSNPFYGKKHTEKTREIIRKKALGRRWSKRAKEKLSITLKSRPDITCPRRCNIYGKEYFSASEASRSLNISKSLLRYRCNSSNWNQYIWLDPPANNKRPLSSRRVLIDNKEYQSIAQAASTLNLHPRTVSKRCGSTSFTNYSFL